MTQEEWCRWRGSNKLSRVLLFSNYHRTTKNRSAAFEPERHELDVAGKCFAQPVAPFQGVRFILARRERGGGQVWLSRGRNSLGAGLSAQAAGKNPAGARHRRSFDSASWRHLAGLGRFRLEQIFRGSFGVVGAQTGFQRDYGRRLSRHGDGHQKNLPIY